MSADDTIDDLFVSLRVLSKITANDKIESNGNVISIDNTPRSLAWLMRWWHGEGNKVNIERAQRVFNAMSLHVQSAADLCEAWAQLDANRGGGGGGSLSGKIEEKRMFVVRALEAMESAITGVENLRTTYKKDENISARIEEKIVHPSRAFIASVRRRLQTQSLVDSPAAATKQQTTLPRRGGHPAFGVDTDDE